jgi:hypothetical protein
VVSFALGTYQTANSFNLNPKVYNIGLILLDYLLMLVYAINQGLQFLQFHQIIPLVNRLILANCIPLFFKFLVPFHMNLFRYQILLSGKLLHP